MAFTRTTTINAAPGGDSVKQGVLDLDTDLTGAFVHLNTLDTTKAPIAKGVTNGDSHDHSGGDGAQIAYSGLSGLPTLGTMSAQNTGTYAGPGSSQAFSVGALTATGINSTPIGSTTPSTGAFTTLSATTAVIGGATYGATLGIKDDWATFRNANLSNEYANYAFLQNSTGSTRINASSGKDVGLTIADSVVCRVSATGLAVTGGISSTTGSQLATSTGNILVGTTTDDGVNKLQVNGSIRSSGLISGARLLVTNTNGITLSDNAVGGFLSYGYNSGRTNPAYHLWYNGISSELMRLNSSGNLLIGTPNDDTTAKIQAAGKISAVGFANANGSYDVFSATIQTGYTDFGFKQQLIVENAGGNAYGWALKTALAGTSAERVRVTGAGELLVGTTTSDGINKLQVNGGISFVKTVTNPGAFSPTHKVPITINGITYYMALTTS